MNELHLKMAKMFLNILAFDQTLLEYMYESIEMDIIMI